MSACFPGPGRRRCAEKREGASEAPSRSGEKHGTYYFRSFGSEVIMREGGAGWKNKAAALEYIFREKDYRTSRPHPPPARGPLIIEAPFVKPHKPAPLFLAASPADIADVSIVIRRKSKYNRPVKVHTVVAVTKCRAHGLQLSLSSAWVFQTKKV